MAIFQFPDDGSLLLYSNWVDALYEFTEWLLDTGLFVETASSNGVGGVISSASDFATIWSYRVLQATNNRGGIAIQHAGSGTAGTAGRSWYIEVCRPGDAFSIGGDATHFPAATHPGQLVGTGSSTSPTAGVLAQELSGSLGLDGNTHTYFTAGDDLEGEIHWQLLVLRFNDIHQALGRFPVIQTAPYDGEEKAIYKTARSNGMLFRADGTWYKTTSVLGQASISTSGAANYLTPVVFSAGGVIKGPAQYYLRSQNTYTNGGIVLVDGVGYYYVYSGDTFFMGPEEPEVYNKTPSELPSYVVAPYIAPVDPGTAPYVTNVQPANGTDITSDTPIQFDLLDESGGLKLLRVDVQYNATGVYETVYRSSTGFAPWFSAMSSRSPVPYGYRYVIARRGGWPSTPALFMEAVDSEGNLLELVV